MGNRGRFSLKDLFSKICYGANGSDALSRASLIASAVVIIANLFVRSPILIIVAYLFLGYSLFRILSRIVARRRKENEWFVNIGRKIRAKFRLLRNKWKDRKTHVYVKCPECKNVLRLVKNKGEHTVVCPCCNKKFVIKQ